MIYETVKEWEACREAMLKAIEETHGTHTEDDVLAQIITGKLKLWRNGKSGVVTEVLEYPRMKVLNAFLTGGDLIREILPLRSELEAYGRAQGCKRATWLATPGDNNEDRSAGWTRATGAEVCGTFMSKEL